MARLVLIIDDDPMMERVVTLMLRGEDYRIIAAKTVEEGFKRIAEQTPDVILCDIMMPGGTNGLDFISRARQMPHVQGVPIISTSASGEYELIEQAIKRGAFAFLPKPFSSTQLIESVSLALQDTP